MPNRRRYRAGQDRRAIDDEADALRFETSLGELESTPDERDRCEQGDRIPVQFELRDVRISGHELRYEALDEGRDGPSVPVVAGCQMSEAVAQIRLGRPRREVVEIDEDEVGASSRTDQLSEMKIAVYDEASRHAGTR